MNRKHSHTLAVITAVMVATTGAVVDTAAGAAPGEVSSGGLRLVASVDSTHVVPAGGDVAVGIPFVHAVTVAGDYSVDVDGAESLRGGQMVAGYLIGCAVDLSNAISVGLAPNVGVTARVSPFVGVEPGVDLAIDAPPGIDVGVRPGNGVAGGLAGRIAVPLAPGGLTAAVIGVADLDEDARFPFTFSHTNTGLTVSGCLAPASAVPFVIVRADTTDTTDTMQTTGYGAQFAF
ncbi:MspA family porin [Nocardia gipuzkoensis]|uniref:MspA family porin n=1 Tax=Nocardia TaxID=1817 RepID=UPI001E315F92|nr:MULTISPECIES: MspA family porin [Nocardia]UGT70926.1 MspA family porin [Nocardia gipuzkoensis]